MTEKTWVGDAPKTCDLCSAPITRAFVDGTTYAHSPGQSRWACMCLTCHKHHGVGLGTGVGQQYEKRCTAVYVGVDGTPKSCEVAHTSHVGSKHKAYTDFGQAIVFSQEDAKVTWVKVRG